MNPFKDVKAVNTVAYQTIMINWLDSVTADAQQGSKTGPLGSTLELLRDFRSPLRKFVADQRLSNADFVNDFLTEFESNNNFLSIGAPALRSEQLSALIRSGIVIILAPGMEVKGDNSWFVTASPHRNADKFKSSTLLEARVPAPNLDRTANPLLEDLVQNANARTRLLQVGDKKVPVGAVDVDPQTDQLYNRAGIVQDAIFIWGVPLEGRRYITSASPRPGVNDSTLQTADKIAAEMLGLPTADNVQMV